MGKGLSTVLEILKGAAQEAAVEFSVSGNCMAPKIGAGEIVWVRHSRHRPYIPGDVLACINDAGRGTVHRFASYRLRNRRLYVLTMPDNEDVVDAPLPMDRVIGRVTRTSRGPFRPSFADRLRIVARLSRRMARKLAGETP